MDGEIAPCNVITEVIQTHGEMFGARPQLWFFGDLDACGGFIFENLATDGWLDKRNRNTAVSQFREQIRKGNGFSRGRGQGDILSLGSRERNDGLKL